MDQVGHASGERLFDRRQEDGLHHSLDRIQEGVGSRERRVEQAVHRLAQFPEPLVFDFREALLVVVCGYRHLLLQVEAGQVHIVQVGVRFLDRKLLLRRLGAVRHRQFGLLDLLTGASSDLRHFEGVAGRQPSD